MTTTISNKCTAKKDTITVIYPAHITYMYDIVSDDNHTDLLEQIFAQWNDGSGDECEFFSKSHIRSLGVGDIVGISGHWYMCMPMGWKKISITEVVNLEKLVEQHPLYKQGAWFALRRVLEENNFLVEA